MAGLEMTVLVTTSSEQQLQLLLTTTTTTTTTTPPPPANAPQRDECHGWTGDDCTSDHFI